ncbi:hypothetical protein EVAR_96077_1 [Eumeta japonica]|uniref:DDE Tnp4 domain-containing protein n=1 Tax=Eumeta variegata TaxID=151549 RepID=A0A4C1W884_EUMVA|nr:hypothetical protein EVAR_96077_1 [Eumeta japonica]
MRGVRGSREASQLIARQVAASRLVLIRRSWLCTWVCGAPAAGVCVSDVGRRVRVCVIRHGPVCTSRFGHNNALKHYGYGVDGFFIRHPKRFRVHPSNVDRNVSGEYTLKHNELRKNPKDFKKYYNMSISSYDELLEKIYDRIKPKNTNFTRKDETIEPGLKLSLTLRYLATKTSFSAVGAAFKVGTSTVSIIVRLTCQAIIDVLSATEMQPLLEEDYKRIAEDFHKVTGFPMCLGAIGARRIRTVTARNKLVECPTFFFVSNSGYYITAVDFAPRSDDSSGILVLKSNEDLLTRLKKNIPKKQTSLNVEDPIEKLPYVFVANDTFKLMPDLMKPYLGQGSKSKKEKIVMFNSKLKNVLRCSEITYALLSNKWEALKNNLKLPPDFLYLIFKAASVLHNFVLRREGYDFEDSLYCEMDYKPIMHGSRSFTKIATKIRDKFTEYFVSIQNELSPEENNLEVEEKEETEEGKDEHVDIMDVEMEHMDLDSP